ncbi:MAG: hypothetical protein QXS41_01995 [Candidatus Woesearchaeota archaeon]
MSYWHEIKTGNISNVTKKRFARFSQGEFEKETISFKEDKSKIKIKTGVFDFFELLEIVARINPKAKVNGKYVTLAKLPYTGQYNKLKKVYEYKFNGEIDLNELTKQHGYFLGSIENEECELKTKKSLPKPSDLLEGFSTLIVKNTEQNKKIINEIFNINEKNLSGEIKYKIIIDKIELPANLDDPEIREKATRYGKIERTLNFAKETKETLNFKI